MSSTTITGTSPLTYSNLIAASTIYSHKDSASSSESIESSASTIKLSSGTPPPTISTIPITTSTTTTPIITTTTNTFTIIKQSPYFKQPISQPQQQQQSSQQPIVTIPRKSKIPIPSYYVAPKSTLQESDSLESTSSSSSSTSLCSASSMSSSSSYMMMMPPKLVRKKSGELVKSSLKLPQLLQRSLSTPQLTARKSVRFASRLINVKMFDGCASPATVSSGQTTPLNEDDDEFDDEDYRFLKQKPRRVDYFDWNWHGNSSKGSSDYSSENNSDDDEDDYWSSPKLVTGTTSKEYRLTSHNIPKIVNTKDSVVWLPSAYVLKTDGKTYLYGLINVKNLAFEKKLYIKLTLNNWKTSIVFGGNSIINFVKSIGDIDQFKFKINVDDLILNKYDGVNVDLQMCLKYEVNNQTYWDNNGGANYQFTLSMVNGIKSYTYKPTSNPASSANATAAASAATPKKDSEESHQFNELISKLILHQQGTKSEGTSPAPPATQAPAPAAPKKSIPSFPQPQRFSFSVQNNFEDHHKPPIHRPFLRQSFSSSDIVSTPNSQSAQQPIGRPKYSQSFRQRQQKKNEAFSNSKPEFSSMCYADLINNYCFANSSNSVPSSNQSTAATSANTSTVSTPVLGSCSPTTASTLYSLSDSIHI
ncbi:GAC1 [[Candida] subhashii]|uniref:GAC1 n=1 Tax=[Candida] subhashii TaxID=561895 RepID=A0A8J5UH39_9ASCO|nr:GAC1 [[Candida] subhashii]KAG7660632.1 GAC1 [[Candida] subhashii]